MPPSATGSLTISAPSLDLAGHSRLGTATLTWAASGAESVEIRVGAADGQLFHRGPARGSASTGAWVRDGETFYLQDGARPETTLATATVNLDATWRRLEFKPLVASLVLARLGVSTGPMAIVPSHHDSIVCRIAIGEQTIYLKASRVDQDESVAIESWAYAQLHTLGVPAPRVLRIDSSRALFPVSVILLSSLPGDSLASVGPTSAASRSGIWEQVGAYLARVHGTALDGGGALDGARYVRDSMISGRFATWDAAVAAKFDGLLARLVATGVLTADARDRLENTFAIRNAEAGPYLGVGSLLHGDFDSSQVFVAGHEPAVTGLLDFDDAAAGDPCWDLATVAQRDGRAALDLVLAGYQPSPAVVERLARATKLYDLVNDVTATTVAAERGSPQQAQAAVDALLATLPPL